MEIEKMTFEQANEELEKSLQMLESGKMTLDETLEVYKRACLLLDFCCRRLESYKGAIKDINEALLEKTDADGVLK